MSMYRLTLSTLYSWDNRLFDNMIFPDGADKENFIDSLILSYGMCEPLYPDFDFMKDSAIPAWSKKWKSSIEKVYNVLESLDYEPIENYDRHEEWSDSPDITRVSQASGTDTNELKSESSQSNENSGTDVNESKVSAFNESGYSPNEQNSTTYGSKMETENNGKDTGTTTYGRKDVNTEQGTTQHVGHVHGNIGVTTSQQMIQSELELRKQSFIDYCTGLFAQDLLLLVY